MSSTQSFLDRSPGRGRHMGRWALNLPSEIPELELSSSKSEIKRDLQVAKGQWMWIACRKEQEGLSSDCANPWLITEGVTDVLVD